MRIEEAFAGPRSGFVVVHTGLGYGDCGVDFEKGQRWLVDASIENGKITTSIASTTGPVEERQPAITRLREKKKPH